MEVNDDIPSNMTEEDVVKAEASILKKLKQKKTILSSYKKLSKTVKVLTDYKVWHTRKLNTYVIMIEDGGSNITMVCFSTMVA